MAALRAGICDVVIPKENERDLADIDQTVRAQLRFFPVTEVKQVLELALEALPNSIEAYPANAPYATLIPPAGASFPSQTGLRQ